MLVKGCTQKMLLMRRIAIKRYLLLIDFQVTDYKLDAWQLQGNKIFLGKMDPLEEIVMRIFMGEISHQNSDNSHILNCWGVATEMPV